MSDMPDTRCIVRFTGFGPKATSETFSDMLQSNAQFRGIKYSIDWRVNKKGNAFALVVFPSESLAQFIARSTKVIVLHGQRLKTQLVQQEVQKAQDQVAKELAEKTHQEETKQRALAEQWERSRDRTVFVGSFSDQYTEDYVRHLVAFAYKSFLGHDINDYILIERVAFRTGKPKSPYPMYAFVTFTYEEDADAFVNNVSDFWDPFGVKHRVASRD